MRNAPSLPIIAWTRVIHHAGERTRRTMRTLIMCGAPIAAACVPGGGPAPRTGSVHEPQRGVAIYDGVATIDPETRNVRARWHIALVPPSADTVRLLLNAGFHVTELSGPRVAHFDTALHDGLETITILLAPGRAGEATSIDVAYAGTLEQPTDSINGLSPGWVELGLDSFWQPIIDDFSQSIVGRVRITLPVGFRLAASGSVETTKDGVLVLTSDVPLPDISFSGSRSLMEVDSLGTRVVYTGQRQPLVGELLASTERCATWLNNLYGQAQPLPRRTMVLAPRTGPGYARKNYIVITQVDTSRVGLSRFVCHELSHYWSIHANSSGPDNWMNEGFAEFISAQYVRSEIGEASYDGIVENWRRGAQKQPPVWAPGSTRRPNQFVSYRKAPLLLSQLDERVGPERMRRILQRYMAEPIATTPQLLRMIADVAGAADADWFRELLAQ